MSGWKSRLSWQVSRLRRTPSGAIATGASGGAPTSSGRRTLGYWLSTLATALGWRASRGDVPSFGSPSTFREPTAATPTISSQLPSRYSTASLLADSSWTTPPIALWPSDRTSSFIDVVRLGSALPSGQRRLYCRRTAGIGSHVWHSTVVGPRDPLDRVETECGLLMNLPVLLESYPFARQGYLCDDCGAARLLTQVDSPS